MTSRSPKNQSHSSRPNSVLGAAYDDAALEIAWPLSRILFAGALIVTLLALLWLVPPTKVQAERGTQQNIIATEEGFAQNIGSGTDLHTNQQTIQHNSATAPVVRTRSIKPVPLTAGFVSAIPNHSAQLDNEPAKVIATAATTTIDATPTSQVVAVPVAASPVVYEEYVDWQTIKVRRGDTLTHIFKRAGLTAADAYELMGRCVEAKRLSKIHPGHELDFEVEDNKLKKLRYRKSVLESQIYRREGDTFSAETISRIPDVRINYQQATLEDSLFLAGQRAGLEQNIIMQLANVFGGVIDFVFDPRKGDTFSIMYEDRYLDGEKIGSGNILAAEYVNAGDSFKAYRYEDSNGESGYYAPDGVSMQKAFLRAPLDFKRISSSFNLRRKHPIHKRIKAHRGIDYAAPRGTPIFAAGDGRVTTAGYTRANGNYIVISHGPQYTTKYLHLTKRHVKKLSRVKKGQIIGTVGSTGYATGPHLHYEFLVNGVHRNPRTILNKLPKAKSIANSEMDRFENDIASLTVRLEKLQQAYNVAELGSGSYTLVEPSSTDVADR